MPPLPHKLKKSGRTPIHRKTPHKNKEMEMQLNIHFEKEAVEKKKLLELELETENLAFELFRREMDLKKRRKLEESETAVTELEDEVGDLKQKISDNTRKK